MRFWLIISTLCVLLAAPGCGAGYGALAGAGTLGLVGGISATSRRQEAGPAILSGILLGALAGSIAGAVADAANGPKISKAACEDKVYEAIRMERTYGQQRYHAPVLPPADAE